MTSKCPGLDGQLQKCGGESVLEGLVTVKSSPEKEGRREGDAGGNWHMFMIIGNWPGEEEKQEFWLAERKGQN